MASIDDLFEASVFIVQNLPKDGDVQVSKSEKLTFYALYKQATNGACDIPKPGFYDVIGNFKWNAWKELGGMDKEEAKQNYIDKLKEKMELFVKNQTDEEWQKHSSFANIAPKLKFIGIIKDNDETKEEEKVHEEPEPLISLSDAEYADAMDEENESRTSSFTHRRRLSLKNSCIRLEKELKSITMQISDLGKAVESRHNLLLNLMKKATVYVLVPRAMSWKANIFIIVWPFLSYILIHWLKKLFIKPL